MTASDGLYGRAAEYEAKKILSTHGFKAIITSDPTSPFDLIALRPEADPLFVIVKRSRSNNFDRFVENISLLQNLIADRLVPGNCQLWILQNRKWIRYQIFAGGIQLIRSEGDDSFCN